ncbi:MAG TPA: hypothetical protein PK306_12610 [Aquabacterium sp.]|jgi:hypothetical protein|nr:hypothetical protein [Aquabacterium sp.]
MTPSEEEAYPLRLFLNPLHVEVRLRAPSDAPGSRMWFSALHAFAVSHHLRAAEVDGLILVTGAGRAVTRAHGLIVAAPIVPTHGRALLLWIARHEAVHRMRFWPWPGSPGRKYRIDVLGGEHG